MSAARAHTRFVRCPACEADNARYLFHKTGIRFVRCAACGMVYVNPAPDAAGVNSLDIEKVRPFENEGDRTLALRDFGRLLDRVAADHQRINGKPLERTLLLGRFLRDFKALAEATRVGLDVAEVDDEAFAQMATASDVRWAQPLLARAPQVVLLHELLESCGDPGVVLGKIVEALPASTLLVVTYTNTDSLPARMMRRHWPPFFEHKTCFFSTGNLATLMARYGRVLKTQYALPVTHTAEYVVDRLAPRTPAARLVNSTPLRNVALPVRAGNRVAVFGRHAVARAAGARSCPSSCPSSTRSATRRRSSTPFWRSRWGSRKRSSSSRATAPTGRATSCGATRVAPAFASCTRRGPAGRGTRCARGSST